MSPPPDPSESAAAVGSPLSWTPEGLPRSDLYGDVYFSSDDGLAETRAVFLDGCGLPGAWAGRSRFVVGELGFGTGLNIAALLQLWRRTRAPGAQLHILSVEAHPVTAAEAARALGRWPELADVAARLTAAWPGHARGWHRVELPAFAAVLDLAVMDVAQALSGWGGAADAWFLDGFAPATNPQMWSDEVLALVAARSRPGARAATFTVAGQVRRGLAAAGFAVEKRPGFGRKRERLEARWAGEAADIPGARRVAIVGAGIAGAAAARAVRALGGEAIVLDAVGCGAGGSGNPAALVTPRLDAGLGDAAALFAQAWARATALYDAVPGAVSARGVLQLASAARDGERFAKIAGSDLFEPGALGLLDAAGATVRLGEPVRPALDQAAAQVVRPDAILSAWAPDVSVADVARLDRAADGWRGWDGSGQPVFSADAVIVACGLGARDLLPEVTLQPVRGQASWTTDGAGGPAAAWGGYVLPAPDGLLFGATHDRDDEGADLREADHARNLATVATALPALAERLGAAPLAGRASVRAVTADRLPLAGGGGAPGLYVLGGFGSRGFSLAPLLAEHVAALAMGAPSPISSAAAALVAPDRFARRAARRGS